MAEPVIRPLNRGRGTHHLGYRCLGQEPLKNERYFKRYLVLWGALDGVDTREIAERARSREVVHPRGHAVQAYPNIIP